MAAGKGEAEADPEGMPTEGAPTQHDAFSHNAVDRQQDAHAGERSASSPIRASALGVQYGGSAFVTDRAEVSPDEQGEEDDVFLPLAGPSTTENGFATAPSSPAKPPNSASKDRHSRKHSRLHSRNLSVFFPRPGAPVTGTLVGYNESSSAAGVSVVPSGDLQGASYADVDGFYPSSRNISPTAEMVAQNAILTGRRGHHHRHSLSHNFFTFLEPASHPHGADPAAKTASPVSPSALPRAVPVHPVRSASSALPINPSQSLRTRYSHLPTPLRIVVAIAFHLPRMTQLKLLIGLATISLGAALWVYGQAGESLATTGLGYLVVFDGIGAIARIWIEGRAAGIEKVWDATGVNKRETSGLRVPFGVSRYITLSHFAQCVFLLFSAVYVCKESVEHVLLLHGPAEDGGPDGSGAHGSAHGSMGHGEALALSGSAADDLDVLKIGIPTGALFVCFALSFFSAVATGNHASLAYSSGPSYFASGQIGSDRHHSPANALFSTLANPFVLITLLFSGGVAASSLILSEQQLGPLDKVLALLESVAMFYIAYPAAVSTGTVLLQTAPPTQTGQMASLFRGLRQIREHPKVVLVAPPKIWQVAPQGHRSEDGAGGPAHRDAQSVGQASAYVVVATIMVHLKADASDSDVLDVTRFSREKCAPAMRWTSQSGFGKASIDAGSGGELTVAVVRGFPQGHES